MADDAHGTDATTFGAVHTPGDALPRLDDGDIIGGRWRLEESSKRGGTGCVWWASDLGLCEPISIKLVDPDSRDRECCARSLREAQEALPRLPLQLPPRQRTPRRSARPADPGL